LSFLPFTSTSSSLIFGFGASLFDSPPGDFASRSITASVAGIIAVLPSEFSIWVFKVIFLPSTLETY